MAGEEEEDKEGGKGEELTERKENAEDDPTGQSPLDVVDERMWMRVEEEEVEEHKGSGCVCGSVREMSRIWE